MTTSENWFRILSLASIWQFPVVKRLAVTHLEQQPCNAVEKIAVYHACSLDEALLLSSYVELCQREDLIEEDEANMLGMPTVLKLVRVREHIWRVLVEGRRSDTEDVVDLIREVFSISGPARIAGPARSEGGDTERSGLSRISEAVSTLLKSKPT